MVRAGRLPRFLERDQTRHQTITKLSCLRFKRADVCELLTNDLLRSSNINLLKKLKYSSVCLIESRRERTVKELKPFCDVATMNFFTVKNGGETIENEHKSGCPNPVQTRSISSGGFTLHS